VLVSTIDKNLRISLQQCFTAQIPLLTATTAFRLERRCSIFPKHCYLHCLHIITVSYCCIHASASALETDYQYMRIINKCKYSELLAPVSATSNLLGFVVCDDGALDTVKPMLLPSTDDNGHSAATPAPVHIINAFLPFCKLISKLGKMHTFIYSLSLWKELCKLHLSPKVPFSGSETSHINELLICLTAFFPGQPG